MLADAPCNGAWVEGTGLASQAEGFGLRVSGLRTHSPSLRLVVGAFESVWGFLTLLCQVSPDYEKGRHAESSVMLLPVCTEVLSGMC